MTLLFPREPVSAISHGAGLLLAVPGIVILWRQTRDERDKQLSLLVYGLSMAWCYAASMLFHAVRGSEALIGGFNTLDYLGVYVYIAGSYTTVGWNLLRGRWRRGTLLLVWSWAAAGALMKLSGQAYSPWFSTGFFLAMGWGVSFIYVELARVVPHRDLRPVLTGGLLYSVGAAIKILEWPNVWPEVVGPHEVFHLFVLAGSAVHYRFVLEVVVPYQAAPEEPAVEWTPALEPLLALSDRSWNVALSTLAAATAPRSPSSA
jgi:hemolysin III